MNEPLMRRALRRRKAIEAAAVILMGPGRSPGGYKLSPQEHWDGASEYRRKSKLQRAEQAIERYEEVMFGGLPPLLPVEEGERDAA